MAGDPVQVERLIAYLVDNAVRYNTGTGDIWIEARTATGNNWIALRNSAPIISPA